MKGGGGGGGPNPISQQIVFFQIPPQVPTIPACVAQIEIPFLFFYCFCFMNPSPSAQNPISQPLKKANPSSHFTPSRPSFLYRPANVPALEIIPGPEMIFECIPFLLAGEATISGLGSFCCPIWGSFLATDHLQGSCCTSLNGLQGWPKKQ